jgi:hypothetical protein
LIELAEQPVRPEKNVRQLLCADLDDPIQAIDRSGPPQLEEVDQEGAPECDEILLSERSTRLVCTTFVLLTQPAGKGKPIVVGKKASR